MSKRIVSFVISILIIFSLVPSFAAETNDANIVFYVSPDGSDSASGKIDAPFLTIERARDEVRKYTEDMKGDIYVYLRGGEYYVNETICFGEQDSGSNGYNVYYKNYPGEEPIIYGGQRVQNWEKYNSFYRAKLNIDADIYNLTENLERCVEACYPNEALDASDAYLHVARIGSTSGMYSRVYYKPEDINESMDFTDVRVRYYPELKYASITLPVDHIDTAGDFFYLDSTGKNNEGDSEGTWIKSYADAQYKLIGSLEFLDTPGEFYVDRDGGWIYYWPKQLPIKDQTIVAPTVRRIFQLVGTDDEHIISNIRFEGLTVSTTDANEIIMTGSQCDRQPNADAMFVLEYAKNIHIKDCRLTNAGVRAIWLRGWAQENVIEGNYIKYTGETCISLDGYNPLVGYDFDSLDEIYCNKKNIVHNNFIRDVGYNSGCGYVVSFYESGENRVTNNEFSKGPRFATGMLTIFPERGGKTHWGVETKETGLYNDGISQDFRLNQHNYIAFNDVYDFERESQDGGVMYGNSTGRGNQFYSNMVHDNYAPYDTESRFFVIYMDGSSVDWRSNYNITYNNACSGGGGTSMILNTAINNEAQNNVYDLTGGTVSGVAVNSANGTVNKNIIYSADQRDIVLSGLNLKNPFSMESNFYYTVDGKIDYRELDGPDTFENRQAAGLYEQQTVVGKDPMFVDPENHDYRLREDSPARELGIESIDQAAIGVTKDFKWRVDQPIQGKNFADADGIDRQLRISNTKDGGWAKFASVNFNHMKENKVWFTYRPQQGGSIELRLDSADGKTLCTIPVESYIDNSYKTVTADIPEISGVHDIYVVFSGNVNVCDFDRMRFGSDYDPLPDVNAITEKLRAAGKLTGAMVLVNADEKATVDTPDDPPGSLRLKFNNAEYNHGFLASGDRMGTFDRGDYIGFTQVKMDGIVSATILCAVNNAYQGSTIELRIDSPTGPIIGSFVTVGTHETKFNVYKPVQVEVTPTTGFHDFFITASGGENGIGDLDWIRFETGTDTAPVQNSIITHAEGVEPVGLRTLGDLRVVSNGSLLQPKEPIYLKDNCVMTPLKYTISKLGYGWNEESLTITDLEGQSIMLVEGKDIAYVNGVAAKLTTIPEKHDDGEWWIPVDLFKLFGDYVDYVESSGYVRIMDVKQTLLDTHLNKLHGSGRNLAFQKNGKANAVATDEIRGRKPFYAFDGNLNTYWQEPNGGKDAWLWVDLRQVYSVSQVEVDFATAPASFNVYVSDETDNPKNWKRVATVSKAVGSSVKLEFPDVHARYVKLGDIKGVNETGVQVKEMRVFE